MNTRSVNSAAGVILAALTQNRTAAGIALALESAQMLMTPETAAELARLRDENPLLHTNLDQLQTAMVKMTAELGQAQRDAAEDLPQLRANLQGWSERGRKAEDALKSALIRVAELEARAAAGPATVWWLAQYEGVEPELFATEAAAREFCDDQAAGEVNQWDWFPDGDGVWQQVETSDLDDRPMSAAPGSVRRLVVRRLDRLTRTFAPTQALREVPDGEHYAATHHDYRVGHDLPEMGGVL